MIEKQCQELVEYLKFNTIYVYIGTITDHLSTVYSLCVCRNARAPHKHRARVVQIHTLSLEMNELLIGQNTVNQS